MLITKIPKLIKKRLKEVLKKCLVVSSSILLSKTRKLFIVNFLLQKFREKVFDGYLYFIYLINFLIVKDFAYIL